MTTHRPQPSNAPFSVLTQLVWCEERGDYFCTWRKVPKIDSEPRSWVRKKPYNRFVNHWWEYEQMKRYTREKTKVEKKWVKPCDPLLKGMENVAALLTDLWWDDGSEREPCQLTVRFEADKTNISIVDKENRQSIYTTASTLQEALEEVEKAVVGGKSLWRPWKEQGGRKK